MIIFAIILTLIAGYFCGCFQTAYIIGKINHIDIRNYGSGNAGTTNTLRTLGKKAAILTFLGDALKSFAAVLIARYLIAPHFDGVIHSQVLCFLAGFGAVLGHVFPFFMGFKGGKGLATTAAALFIFDFRLGIISLLLFLLFTPITRYVSLGSIIIVIAIPIEITIFYNKNPNFVYLIIIGSLYTILVLYKHKGNIKRLLNGTERKLGEKVERN